MMALGLLLASLWTVFQNPPDSARPWCYWWWINGHVDCETITADLESMKELGFGGVLMFDSRGYWDDDEHVVNPKPVLEWGSPAWQDLVVHSVRECKRLGLNFTMNASASGGWLNGFRNGVEYQVDVMDAEQVARHLDFVLEPILKRIPDLVGSTFTHVYSVSYEGKLREGGSWADVRDRFYGTMSAWANRHGLKMYSEASGPWTDEGLAALGDCDQPGLFKYNDIAQGEFWPLRENAAVPESGHANANARYFARAAVLASRRQGKPVISLEAFTHMNRHYTVDPAFLKPLADMAFADGVNRLVWHTFTCSPKRFGVPGLEYFAGSHVGRNVTWQKDGAAFVRYLGRCQALLQRGTYVDDGEFVDVCTNYYGWGRYRRDAAAQYTMTHRRDGKTDFFFVAGEGKGDVLLKVPSDGRTVELWDAVSVTRTAPPTSLCPEGLRVSIDLPIGGSCFLVVSAAEEAGSVPPPAVPKPVKILPAPWSVSFDYPAGVEAPPPAPVILSELCDLTSWGNDQDAESRSVRYFSGCATYQTQVELTKTEAESTTLIDIGVLKTGLARVVVNGKDCGVVWCAPWRVNAAKAFRPGTNDVVIRYVNNWHNRLVGDCRLPEDRRVTRSNLHYWTVPRQGREDRPWNIRPTLYSGPSVSDALQPSGLVGPVALLSEKSVGSPPDRVLWPNGGLRREMVPAGKWPGQNLVVEQPPLDIRSFKWLDIALSNRTDSAVGVTLAVKSEGLAEKRPSGKVALAPHGAGSIFCDLSSAPWVLDRTLELVGMNGYPYAPWGDATRYDLRRITRFCLFLPEGTSADAFEVVSVKVGGESGAKHVFKADSFLPFVDRFGQFKHLEWPGKIHSDADMTAAKVAEDAWLAQHENGPDPSRDEFGGWVKGPQLKATGYFRTEKVNGRWWFVDPKGRLFWSLGINCVCQDLCLDHGQTPISFRDNYFETIPSRDDPDFGRFHAKQIKPAAVGFYAEANHCPYETYSFAGANLLRKYGRDWKRLGVDRAHRRMRAWGINTLGAWSSPEICQTRRTPYTVILSTGGAPRIKGSVGTWGPLPDPARPEFVRVLRERARQLAAQVKTDPWCLGIFVDNEMSWTDTPEIGLVAELYYETVARVLRDELPNHLYLGSRIATGGAAVYRACARSCDVVSVNCYAHRFDRALPEGAVDKPILNGEFHFGAYDRGLLHPGLVATGNQKERAEAYKEFVRSCLDDPQVVGTHWFQWMDQPLTGRSDGENYQIGFLTETDAPYSELVSAAREVSAELYGRRALDSDVR